jgi:hypothetical protein
MNDHERYTDQLVGLALGELSGPEAADIRSHVAQCQACRDELNRLENVLVSAGQVKTLSVDERMCASAGRDVLLAVEQEQTQTSRGVSQSRAALIWRLTMKSPIGKLAAAAAVTIVAILGITTIDSPAPAFADVVWPILAARTAVFTVITEVEGQPSIVMKGKFMEPGLGRHTMKAEDPATETITVVDYAQGKGIVLMPGQKTAMVIEFENQPQGYDHRMMNPFEELRERIVQAQENEDASVAYLGRSQVNGRGAVGYQMKVKGADCTMWVDADSLLPLQVEYATTETIGQPVTVTMLDIRFDVPLDPADFSTEVPEGYTAMTMQADVSEPGEVDLVEMLSLWVETTGKFPSALTMEAIEELEVSLGERGVTFDKEQTLADPAFRQWLQHFQKVNRSLMFVRNLPDDADWHYAGADAPFGDETAPIFWYRPEGSATYRVIYADLSVRDVLPDALPK